MWIMTPFGIIMPATPAEGTIPAGEDPAEWLQVRARDRKALTHLKRRFMGNTLGKIQFTPKRDYEYRAYCRKVDFVAAMTAMIEEIDYEKFKPQAVTTALHDLYVNIWYVVFGHYQRRAPLTQRKINWWEDK